MITSVMVMISINMIKIIMYMVIIIIVNASIIISSIITHIILILVSLLLVCMLSCILVNNCASRGIGRQGAVLGHRNCLQKEPMPCRHMPLLVYT